MTEPRRPLHVAVAEGEPDTRESLREALARLGHDGVAVASGTQLVELCRGSPPDLVIADIKMPGLGGIAAAEALNRDRDIPVILITGHHEAKVLERAVVDHVMAYLVKPVDAARLAAAVRVALARFRRFLEVREEAADARQALEDRKVVERGKGVIMRRLGVDEDEAYRRLREHARGRGLRLVEFARAVLVAEELYRTGRRGVTGRGEGSGRAGLPSPPPAASPGDTQP
jgi:two-component system, response regulator PdtaR